jgi:hypothetical protein
MSIGRSQEAAPYGEPTSGLEPLTCSSYEFACVRPSLS